MSKTDKAGIYVDCYQLHKVLYAAQFEMDKKDRIVLGARLLTCNEQLFSDFSVAYGFNENEGRTAEERQRNFERKSEYIMRFVYDFEALKMNCRIAIELDIIKKKGTVTKIREYIASIEEGVAKWRTYLNARRQDDCPERQSQTNPRQRSAGSHLEQ